MTGADDLRRALLFLRALILFFAKPTEEQREAHVAFRRTFVNLADTIGRLYDNGGRKLP